LFRDRPPCPLHRGITFITPIIRITGRIAISVQIINYVGDIKQIDGAVAVGIPVANGKCLRRRPAAIQVTDDVCYIYQIYDTIQSVGIPRNITWMIHGTGVVIAVYATNPFAAEVGARVLSDIITIDIENERASIAAAPEGICPRSGFIGRTFCRPSYLVTEYVANQYDQNGKNDLIKPNPDGSFSIPSINAFPIRPEHNFLPSLSR
jgi:hypothetical protein